MSEIAPAFFLGLPVPIAAAVITGLITLCGTILTVLGAWLVWFLARRKGETEKTWEKRRELYTQMLLKLRDLKEMMASDQDAYERYNPFEGAKQHLETIINPGVYGDGEEKIYFEERANKLREFVDEHILYISDEMEEIVSEVFEASYRCHGMPSRGMLPIMRHERLYAAATGTLERAKHQAQREIRIRSTTFRIKSVLLKAWRRIYDGFAYDVREGRSWLHVRRYHAGVWLKEKLRK